MATLLHLTIGILRHVMGASVDVTGLAMTMVDII